MEEWKNKFVKSQDQQGKSGENIAEDFEEEERGKQRRISCLLSTPQTG
jgi:hypothetical protein